MPTLRLVRTIAVNVLLAVFWSAFAVAHFFWYGLTGEPVYLALVVYEGFLVLAFLIRREASQTIRNGRAWVIALVGTFAPLLLVPSGMVTHGLLARWFIILGVLLQVSSLISLGRSMGIVPANRGIATLGFYEIVRHPMYLSYTVILAGYLLLSFSWYNLVIALVALGANLIRAWYEEQYLDFDPHYRAYKERVRWRFLPFIF